MKRKWKLGGKTLSGEKQMNTKTAIIKNWAETKVITQTKSGDKKLYSRFNKTKKFEIALEVGPKCSVFKVKNLNARNLQTEVCRFKLCPYKTFPALQSFFLVEDSIFINLLYNLI